MPPDDADTLAGELVEPSDQRALTDRFLPAWLRGRNHRGVPELRWIPGRRRTKLPEDAGVGADPGDEADELVPPREPGVVEVEEPDQETARSRGRLGHLATAVALRLRWLLRVLRAQWSRLLQLRMVVWTMLLSVVATTVVGAVLAGQVSERLLDARRAQAIAEASRSTTTFTQLLDNSTAKNSDAIQQAVREGLNRIDSPEDAASSGILLLRSQPKAQTGLPQGFFSGRLRVDDVPAALRQQVRDTGDRQVQSVTVKDSQTRRSYPGLIVGQKVSIPMAGRYELYFLSSLEGEQRTLLSVQRMLAVGMVCLVGLLGLVSYLVSRMVVDPVRQAALAAERLAAGRLDERVDVRGNDELARLAMSFNGMAAGLQAQIEQLEELSRVQQRFVSDVSHELRTPLTTMKMAGEVIFDSRDDLDPAAKRSAELLTGQLDRFDALLADLLEISRFDAGAAALDAEPTDLATLVNRVVGDAQPLAERKPTQLRVHLPAESVTAEVDHRRIERVLRNLVDNAIEHSEGKPVDLWLAADDEAVAILVRDYGVGLTREELARVFDKFWRADPARARTTGGTGLGLAIAAEDALLHGGRLEVWGRRDAGAAFRLTLPRAQGGRLRGSPLPLGPRVPVE